MRAITITAAALTAFTLTGCKTSVDPNIDATPPTVSGNTTPQAGTPQSPTQSPTQSPPKSGHVVVYRIRGSAPRALITYSTPSGQEQENGAAVPWKKAIKTHGVDTATISAQNQAASGTITCEITVDGKLVKRSTSSGGYAIATCTATIGF